MMIDLGAVEIFVDEGLGGDEGLGCSCPARTFSALRYKECDLAHPIGRSLLLPDLRWVIWELTLILGYLIYV